MSRAGAAANRPAKRIDAWQRTIEAEAFLDAVVCQCDGCGRPTVEPATLPELIGPELAKQDYDWARRTCFACGSESGTYQCKAQPA